MSENELPMVSESFAYQTRVCGWVQEALSESESFLREEPGYNEIDKNIKYIMDGRNQADQQRSPEVAWYPINRVSKAHGEIVAGLTDVKPLFAYRTFNPAYDMQSQLLNKLITAWWLNNDIDLKLADVINWSSAAGIGYALPSWSAYLGNGFGDIDLETIDPRDVFPIRPPSRLSIQSSLGVIIRNSVSLNFLKTKYPGKSHLIKADRESSTWAKRVNRVANTVRTAIQRLQSTDQTTSDKNFPGVDVYSLYIRDHRINTSSNTIPMGDPDTNWFYEVEPGKRLYPRGRLIICTRDIVLSDGPNPYWHGMFPVCKLVLDPYPWSYFGKSAIKDVIPINDLLTELVSKVAQAARKTLKPGVIADKNAVADNVWRQINTEKEGMKLKINPSMGEGIKLTDPVAVPNYIMDIIRLCVEQIDDISGTQGLQDLLSLKQLPSADSIEKIQAAMTPAIRRRGRVIESFLRELADQVKFNIFQFYSQKRRIQMLGDQGLTFEDFDFDPGNMIPMPNPADTRPFMERAIDHISNFPFYVAQNSLLSISQMGTKMLYLQLRRQGEIDRQTLLEIMEIPNISQINDRLAAEQQSMAMSQIAAMAASGMAPGMGGPGRPPSGQQPPKLEMKGDGRTVVSESG